MQASARAAGEMLHAAEPFLERNLHPTVIIRGYVRALEDALAIIDSLAFPIDTADRAQMLKIISSCIGTKFTSRFGTLMPVGCPTLASMLRPGLRARWAARPGSSAPAWPARPLPAVNMPGWRHPGSRAHLQPVWMTRTTLLSDGQGFPGHWCFATTPACTNTLLEG